MNVVLAVVHWLFEQDVVLVVLVFWVVLLLYSMSSIGSGFRSMELSLVSREDLPLEPLPELSEPPCRRLRCSARSRYSRFQKDFLKIGFMIGALTATIPAIVSLTPQRLIVSADG